MHKYVRQLSVLVRQDLVDLSLSFSLARLFAQQRTSGILSSVRLRFRRVGGGLVALTSRRKANEEFQDLLYPDGSASAICILGHRLKTSVDWPLCRGLTVGTQLDVLATVPLRPVAFFCLVANQANKTSA